MQLTLEEAAARMGKSVRQIRYSVQLGEIKAQKRGGRWFVELEDTPQSAGQAAAAARKRQVLRNAAEDVLGPDSGTRRYSVSDLKAFQVGLRVYNDLAKQKEQPALPALRRALHWLSCGCHRFEAADKSDAYRRARDEVCGAICELLLSQDKEAKSAASVLEMDLLPALAGLLRRTDRHRPR